MYLDTSIVNENDISGITNNGSINKFFSINRNHYAIKIYKDNYTNLNSIILCKWNGAVYQRKMNGRFQIKPQQDGINKILVTKLTSIDGSVEILYSKGQNGRRFIKSVYCMNNYPTNYPTHSEYVIEQSNATCQDEFESLCNQQYYNERNCASLISINGIGEPQIVINKNGIGLINTILRRQIRESDGFNYGLYNQLNYNWIMLQCQHINNIRLFPQLGSEYFSESKKLYDFLSGFGLKLLQRNDPFTQNFAIIPVCADGHISTLLLDLRIGNILGPIPERLYSFDSSLYHYDQNIFSGLITEGHKLSTQSLQLTGCCGYWTSCFIEECYRITDIEEVKRQFKTGEMQLEVACRVSKIIDKSVRNNRLLQRIEQEGYEGNDDHITIKIKDTNKYFLLDRKDIHKSTCVDLKAIYNLIQQGKSQLEVVGDGLAKLEEQIVKQNQKLFKIKQTRINEIKEQIEYLNGILKRESHMCKIDDLYYRILVILEGPESAETLNAKIDKDKQDKLFCDNLAKFEHLKNRIGLNLGRQQEYLSIQGKFCRSNLEKYLEEVVNYNNLAKHFEELGLFYNNLLTYVTCDMLYAEYNKNYEKLQQSSPDLKDYFEQQQQYYNQLLVVEQRNIKNIRNNYSQIPNTNQLQLNKVNGCISEMGKSLDENSKIHN